jgi:arsenite methyltransferase
MEKKMSVNKVTKIASVKRREAHWENVFQTKDHTQVLWHQNSPDKSIQLINKYAKKDDALIDAGCGASLLVDALLDEGYTNITLLDTSKTSLEIVKKRLPLQNISYICEDILNFSSSEKYDLWHDRAVFHFLTTQTEQRKYFEVLKESLKKDGIAIISTFGINGPLECAGLEIVQYDEAKMREILPKELKLMHYEAYMHITPKNTQQHYSYFVLAV